MGRGTGSHAYSSSTVKLGMLDFSHHRGMILVCDNRHDGDKRGGWEKLIRPSELRERIKMWVHGITMKPKSGWIDEDFIIMQFCQKGLGLCRLAEAYGDPCSMETQLHHMKHNKKRAGSVPGMSLNKISGLVDARGKAISSKPAVPTPTITP